MADARLHVPKSSPVGTLIFIMWGMIVWGLQFTGAYVGHTFLCRVGADDYASDLLIAGLTIVALMALAAVGLFPERTATVAGVRLAGGDRRAIIRISRTIVGLATVAAIWTATGLFIVDACVGGR
jgi:hypothetical protein